MALAHIWTEVDLNPPVGPSLYWGDVRSGWGSGSSCCLSGRWTSCWLARTPSRAASGAPPAPQPPPESTDFILRQRSSIYLSTKSKKNMCWCVLTEALAVLIPFCPPGTRSWRCGSRLSGHGWGPWILTRQWCQQLSGHRGKTSHLVPEKSRRSVFYSEREGEPGNNARVWPPDSRTYLKHAAIVSEAFEVIGDAHAELLGSRFHGAADHEAVPWLKHMQRAGDGGEGHGAHKDGHFLV